MTQLKGRERAEYIRAMFGQIAPRYDLMNMLMTGGRDRAWRQLAVRAAAAPPGGLVLDVAAGTGDMALEAVRQIAGARVVGVDFTLRMIQIGQAKPGAAPIHWAGADAQNLPFGDNVFDAVTSAFMLRNVNNIATALAEQRRVVRPGRRVVCLEISPTPVPIFKRLFQWYFYHLVPLIGGLVSGQPAAYSYLPNSLTHFLTADELAQMMRLAGLQQVYYRRLMLGAVAIHMGIK